MELTEGRLVGLNFTSQAVRSYGEWGARARGTVQRHFQSTVDPEYCYACCTLNTASIFQMGSNKRPASALSV